MSSTIKQAIQALKSRVADAFAAVEAKGGTLPATQDSSNLPAAIASIPSGGKVYVGNYINLASFWRDFTGTDAGEQNLDFTYRTSVVYLQSCFFGAGNIKKVDLRNWRCIVVNLYQAFGGMSLCESIVFGENIDTSNCDWGYAFYGFGRNVQSSIIDLRGVSVNSVDPGTFAYASGVKSLRVDDRFKVSVILTSTGIERQGYIVFFNDLATLPEGTSYTIRISRSVYDTLSDEDKAIATSKGWILQRG